MSDNIWHYFSFDEEGYLLLGYSNFPDNFLCVNLNDFSEKDVLDLWKIINSDEVQAEPFLMNVLSSMRHPRCLMNWRDYLVARAFDVEWWRIEKLISPKQLSHYEESKNTVHDRLPALAEAKEPATVDDILYRKIDKH